MEKMEGGQEVEGAEGRMLGVRDLCRGLMTGFWVRGLAVRGMGESARARARERESVYTNSLYTYSDMQVYVGI